MSALAEQQQSLLDALFTRRAPGAAGLPPGTPSPHFSGVRGLQAYQANAHAQAQRSLRATYPVVAQLVGADDFSALCTDFWHRHPPELGDLAQWGSDAPAFLQGNLQLASEPYLADVARVEWALHQCALAADIPPDLASLALLSANDPSALALRLASGTAVVTSTFPVASIVRAHLHADPSLEQAGLMLRNGVAEAAVVWRQHYRPCVAACSTAEAALLGQLLRGSNLLSALGNAPGLDFTDWLTRAVQCSLVIGATAQ